MDFPLVAFAHKVRFSAVTVCLLVAACSDDTGQQAAAPPPPPSVTTAKVTVEEVRESVRFVGQIAAVDEVDLIARVSGYLEEKSVPDGAKVKEGDVLFTIERVQYEAALMRAKADLAGAKADAALKAADEKRDKDLLQKGHVSEAAYEATLAQKQQAEASVEAAGSALKQAELDLSYTRISAPFTGQIGKTAHSIGEVVGPSVAPLAKLTRLSPVYVNFSVGEAQYLDAVKVHNLDPADIRPSDSPNVRIILPNGDAYEETGKIVYIDNHVDTATGTISFRSQFDNADNLLLAGTYVTVILEDPETSSSLVVPQAAIQRDQQGPFVLAISEDRKTVQRYLKLGQQVGANVVVNTGLKDGEEVIVEGLQKVRPGVEVDPVLVNQPAG